MKLLTKDAMEKINRKMSPDAKYGDVFLEIAKFQAELTAKEISDRIIPILPDHIYINVNSICEEIEGEVHAPDCPRCKIEALFFDIWEVK